MQKTIVALDSVCNFVKERYGIEREDVSYINSGEFSSAFLLSTIERQKIIRINLTTDMGFRKDSFIYDTYPNIPTPKIIENGRFGETGFFSLSEMVSGKQLRESSIEENILVLPSLFSVMNQVHTSPLSSGDLLNRNNWKNILKDYTEKDCEKVQASFFEMSRYKQLLKVFERLVAIELPDSYLLHGDFGRTNIFADDSQITGIIDWSESMKGDFLWDLAWIAFWPTEIDYVGSYFKFNKGNELLDLKNFEQRVFLYTLVIGIHTLLFSGTRNDEETYLEAVARTEKFLT